MNKETTTDAIRVLTEMRDHELQQARRIDQLPNCTGGPQRERAAALDSAIGAMKMLDAATDTLTRIAAMTDPDDLTNHRNYEPDECLQEVYDMATKSLAAIQEAKSDAE